jgi:hypothetical protein
VRRDHFAFGVTTLISIVTILLIAAYTYYAALQVAESEGTNNISRLALRESSARAKTANEIASSANDESLQISREALTSVQRAFVYPRPDVQSVPPDTVQRGQVRMQIVWENSGSTPANAVTIHVSHHFSPTPLPQNFDYPDYWDQGVPHVSTPTYIPPKGSTASDMMSLSKEEIMGILGGRLRYYIWGWARYRDVFPSTPRHLTEFCYEVEVVPLDSNHSQPAGIRLENCKQHNCSDEECKSR